MRREPDRERQSRAADEESPQQREHRLATPRQQDREHRPRARAKETSQRREQRLVIQRERHRVYRERARARQRQVTSGFKVDVAGVTSLQHMLRMFS